MILKVYPNIGVELRHQASVSDSKKPLNSAPMYACTVSYHSFSTACMCVSCIVNIQYAFELFH